jgi:hypothetical protein
MPTNAAMIAANESGSRRPKFARNGRTELTRTPHALSG